MPRSQVDGVPGRASALGNWAEARSIEPDDNVEHFLTELYASTKRSRFADAPEPVRRLLEAR